MKSADLGDYQTVTTCSIESVYSFDITTLSVSSMGAVEASSETLTRAAIYLANNRINAIAHVHHPALWRQLLDLGAPATAEALPYGTAEMARAVAGLAQGEKEGSVVMKGHADGVICFGPDLARVQALLEEQMSALPG